VRAGPTEFSVDIHLALTPQQKFVNSTTLRVFSTGDGFVVSTPTTPVVDQEIDAHLACRAPVSEPSCVRRRRPGGRCRVGGAGWREQLRAGPAVVDQERADLVMTAAVEAPRSGPDSE
jgi:hypothetical protein